MVLLMISTDKPGVEEPEIDARVSYGNLNGAPSQGTSMKPSQRPAQHSNCWYGNLSWN